jgi:hypothetical protein
MTPSNVKLRQQRIKPHHAAPREDDPVYRRLSAAAELIAAEVHGGAAARRTGTLSPDLPKAGAGSRAAGRNDFRAAVRHCRADCRPCAANHLRPGKDHRAADHVGVDLNAFRDMRAEIGAARTDGRRHLIAGMIFERWNVASCLARTRYGG